MGKLPYTQYSWKISEIKKKIDLTIKDQKDQIGRTLLEVQFDWGNI